MPACLGHSIQIFGSHLDVVANTFAEVFCIHVDRLGVEHNNFHSVAKKWVLFNQLKALGETSLALPKQRKFRVLSHCMCQLQNQLHFASQV